MKKENCMTLRNNLFTSESVSEGHPDKVADQISDAVLDAILAQDPTARVACDTYVTAGMALVGGEITTDCDVDIPQITRNTIRQIGYVDSEMGFDCDSCAVLTAVGKQSPDISRGVTAGQGLFDEQGAGDQGLMFGYACKETDTLMPAPIHYAHSLSERLAEVRKDGTLPWLRPDGKSQVSVRYVDDKPQSVERVVIAAQHSPDIQYAQIKEGIIEQVIKKVIPDRLLSGNVEFFINSTGRFVIGGPAGDTGLTGRKVIVDTYGGMGRHGGGAFSGKDPSKVDRSGSYMARHIAKNIVAAGLADRCEVQVAYAIGVPDPVSVMVDTFGTGKIPEDRIAEIITRLFPLKPAKLIDYLDLLRPVYFKTAAYGHFGRELPEFTWEAAGQVEKIKGMAF